MQSNTTKLSVATQAKLVEEFNLPDDIFEEMFIDEFAIQKSRDSVLTKTIVLKHNSAKVVYEYEHEKDLYGTNEFPYNEDADDE